MLRDKFGRYITYLRLGVTDVCNLRCFYCMPQNPVFSPKKNILSDDEMLRLVRIFMDLGIKKIRITGGEPFARKNLIPLLQEFKTDKRLQKLNITTNASLITPYISEMSDLFQEVTVSLDSLDRHRFQQIRGRNEFDTVWTNIQTLLQHGVSIKLNMVVLANFNIEDIYPMLELTQNQAIQVRFIEEMPFNGKQTDAHELPWSHTKILDFIRQKYDFQSIEKSSPTDTANYYQIPDSQGQFGVIPAYSRTFCGTCNRVRVNAKGQLRTCLYSQKNLNLLELLRNHTNDNIIKNHIIHAVHQKAENGWVATQEDHPYYESMHILGG